MKSDLIIKLVKICCVLSVVVGVNLAYADQSRTFTFYYGNGVSQISLQFNGINNKGTWFNHGEDYEVSVTNGYNYTKIMVKGQMDTGDVQFYGNYNDNNSIPVNSKEDMPTGKKFDFITSFYMTINGYADGDGAFDVASQTNASHTWWLGDYYHGSSSSNSKGNKCLDYRGYSFVPKDDDSVMVNSYSCAANGY